MQFSIILMSAFAAISAASPVVKRDAAGRATYYNTMYPTYSSCGDQPQDTDMIAALAPGFMPSACGQKLRVTNTDTGISVEVTAVDTCMACAGGEVAIDLSPAAFSALASMDDGTFPTFWSTI